MNIAVLDDYQDTIRTLACYSKMAGHQVTIWKDHTKDPDVLAERLKDVEAVTLLRERTPLRAPLLERLDKLRLISQVGVFPTSTWRPAPAAASSCRRARCPAGRRTPRPSSRGG